MKRFLAGCLILVAVLAGCRLPKRSGAFVGTPPSARLTGQATASRLAIPQPPTSSPSLPSPPPEAPSPYPAPVQLVTATLQASPTATRDPAGCLPSTWPVEYGLVQWVLDGQTIVVDIQGQLHTVRYLGVEAPRPGEAGWLSPEQPKERNAALVTDQVVSLWRDVSDRDSNGQLLRYVQVGDMFINYQLVAEGYLQANSLAPDTACEAELLEAQRLAIQSRAGMWALMTATFTLTPPPYTPATATSTLSSPTLTPSFATASLTASLSPTSGTATMTPTGTLTPATRTPTPTGTLTPATRTPTLTVTGSLTATPGIIYIEAINYLGLYAGESDEYVQIRNGSASPVNLLGWMLVDAGSETTYEFPAFNLQPGQSCRVYTNEFHQDTCGFSFLSPSPVWSNTSGCAELYNPGGGRIDEYCYP